MHNISLAPSVSRVAPSQIRAIADVAFPMDGVLKLHFGESDMQTPQYLKDAAYQAMNEGYTFYSENAGLHQIDLNPANEIVITASGVQALNVSIRCVIDPGDEAIVLTPNWPNGSAIVSLFGGYPKEIPLVWTGERYKIDFAALGKAITPRTRLLIYTSPSNPLGWVVARRDLVKKATQLNEFIVSHAPSMIQKAGEAALKQGEEEVTAMVKSLREKVNFSFDALRSMKGVSVAGPEGAFYLFPQIEGVDDSFSFALTLLKETKVAVAPGIAFGNGGEGAIRICCAADMSILEEAMERIGNYLAKI
jgi:aspartate/methionine/tyrosine aminotransferase